MARFRRGRLGQQISQHREGREPERNREHRPAEKNIHFVWTILLAEAHDAVLYFVVFGTAIAIFIAVREQSQPSTQERRTPPPRRQCLAPPSKRRIPLLVLVNARPRHEPLQPPDGVHAEAACALQNLMPRERIIGIGSCDFFLEEWAREEREVAVAPDVVGDHVVQILDAQGGGEEAPGRAVDVVRTSVAVRGEEGD